jgi:hypothetical protein
MAVRRTDMGRGAVLRPALRDPDTRFDIKVVGYDGLEDTLATVAERDAGAGLVHSGFPEAR